VTDRPPSVSGHGVEVAMLLLNNSGVGGAERRFARAYQGLKKRNRSVALIVNESLLTALKQMGVLDGAEPPALVIPEWMGGLVRHVSGHPAARNAIQRGFLARIRQVAAFWLRKMDYAMGCASVGWWVMRARPRVMHLVLGGVYVALPLQLLGGAPPAVVSVTNPSLRKMVGAKPALWLYRLALRRASVVDALTDNIRQTLTREGIAGERIRVPSGSCVDADRFRPAPEKRRWVVFAGRLVPDKNPALFVEACAMVSPRVPDARFFVLGEGVLQSEIDALVRRHGLEAVVEVGWTPRVGIILAEALVYVSLQREENYPSQALLEAMACGAAIVATDVGLTWKLVDESVGMRVEAKPVAVADAVVRLLDNPGQAQAMGRKGRERVLRDHSLDAYLNYLEGVYANACRNSAGVPQ
jgi:glycosyltransferase involved in cell wall biosynthesis